MNPYVFITTGVLFIALLFVHCSRTRGRRIAISFFSAAVVFAVARENLNAFLPLYEGMPQYVPGPGVLTLGNTPVGLCMGWIITAYISWTLAERMLHRVGTGGAPDLIFPVVMVSAVIVSAFALALEATGSEIGMWIWNPGDVPKPGDRFYSIFKETPLISLVGWANVMTVFLFGFLMVEASPYRWAPWRWAFLVPPVVAFVMFVVDFWPTMAVWWGLLLALALFWPLTIHYPGRVVEAEGPADEPEPAGEKQ